jgi:MFS family permease
VLGVLTIVTYGTWYYGYGVLIEPIHDDQHWSRGLLGTVFGVAILVNGLGAAAGGRLLDRAGPRSAFLVAAVVSSSFLVVASYQHDPYAFGLAFGIGGGITGALGFYHVTQAAAARSAPGRPARAISRLTIIGALSSPIFLPLTAWLVQATDWRTTLRIDAGILAVAFLAAAAIVPDRRNAGGRPAGRAIDAFRAAWLARPFRRLLAATLLAGAAMDIMLAFQVPIMRDAGLTLGTAATIAGLRGFAQLAGRLPLGLALRRIPARIALTGAYALGSLAALLLLGSGWIVAAIAYSAVAGIATGASSPLQGIYTAEVVGDRDLGLLLGVQQALYGIAGASGPVAVGILYAVTESWTSAIVLAAAGFVGAAALLATKHPLTTAP